MFSVSQHLSKSYWALEFCRRLLRNLKEFFSVLLERTEYNCYCSKISGILASPLSPGIGYVTDTIFIRCQFFLCRHFITKIPLLNVYYIFCDFLLFLQGYFLKDVAFKVPLQTHRNVNFWKHSLRSVCSTICNLVLPTEGFTESHCYLACTYFQFWNKSEMSCDCRKTSGKIHSFAMQQKETQWFWLIFILPFLLFSESETQTDPWRNSGTGGANWHGSDLKKIFTPTSVKENCEVSYTAVCRMHVVRALKYQFWFFL